MRPDATTARSFMVEWYQPRLTGPDLHDAIARLGAAAATVTAEGHAVNLVMTLNAPDDEVLFGVLTADSAETVTRTCRSAGWPVDRITGGVQTHIARPVQSDDPEPQPA